MRDFLIAQCFNMMFSDIKWMLRFHCLEFQHMDWIFGYLIRAILDRNNVGFVN